MNPSIGSLTRTLHACREAIALVVAAGIKRWKAVSDLEERECAVGPAVDLVKVTRHEDTRREDKRKAIDLKRELEEFFAAKQPAALGVASISIRAHGYKEGWNFTRRSENYGKIWKVSWEGSADYYTAAKLQEFFHQLGKDEDIVIKTRKSRSRGLAIVAMTSNRQQ